jgi:hypothetical protein
MSWLREAWKTGESADTINTGLDNKAIESKIAELVQQAQ